MSRLDTPGSVPETLSGGLSRRIYVDLKDRLVGGEFPAGVRLSMEGLRADYGVSKQPLMEAFRMLAADGIVEIVPQVGCRPVVYTRDEVVDFFTVFAASEGAVAGAAAARRTDEQLRILENALHHTEDLSSLSDPVEARHRYRRANREFHGIIQAMAGSRTINMLSGRLWDLSDYLISTTNTDRLHGGRLGARHEEHAHIVQALAAGDVEGARQEMCGHILRIVDQVGFRNPVAHEARTVPPAR